MIIAEVGDTVFTKNLRADSKLSNKFGGIKRLPTSACYFYAVDLDGHEPFHLLKASEFDRVDHGLLLFLQREAYYIRIDEVRATGDTVTLFTNEGRITFPKPEDGGKGVLRLLLRSPEGSRAHINYSPQKDPPLQKAGTKGPPEKYPAFDRYKLSQILQLRLPLFDVLWAVAEVVGDFLELRSFAILDSEPMNVTAKINRGLSIDECAIALAFEFQSKILSAKKSTEFTTVPFLAQLRSNLPGINVASAKSRDRDGKIEFRTTICIGEANFYVHSKTRWNATINEIISVVSGDVHWAIKDGKTRLPENTSCQKCESAETTIGELQSEIFRIEGQRNDLQLRIDRYEFEAKLTSGAARAKPVTSKINIYCEEQ